jgi:hypothetical protein
VVRNQGPSSALLPALALLAFAAAFFGLGLARLRFE